MAVERLVIEIDADTLSGLNRSFKQVERQLGKLTKGVKGFSRDSERGAKRFEARMKDVEKRLRSTADRLDRVSQGLRRFGTVMTASVVAPIGLAVRSATKFQQGMAYVNTIAKLNERDLGALGKRIRELSVEMGKPAVELAAAQYQILSSGVEDASDAYDLLRVAAEASIAGQAEVPDAVRTITAALNAYGMEVDQAGRVSDVLFKTIDRGIIEFPQLANSLGMVVGSAAQAEVTIEELGAALATLTKRGLNPEAAIVSLNQVLANVIKPSAQAKKAAEALGLEFSIAALKSKGFAEFLGEIQQKAGDNEEALTALFGNVRSVRGAFALTGEGAKMFAADLAEMQKAAGATGEAVGKMRKTAQFEFNRLKAAVDSALIVVGTEVLPGVTTGVKDLVDELKKLEEDGSLKRFGESVGKALGDIASHLPKVIRGVTKLSDWFDNLNPKTQEFLMNAALLAGPLTHLVGVLASVASAVMLFSTKLTGVWKLLGPVGIAIGLLSQKFHPLHMTILLMTGLVKELARRISEALQNAWTAVTEYLGRMYEGGKALMRNIGAGIKAQAKATVQSVRNVLQKIRNLMPGSDPKDPTSPLYGLEEAGRAIGENLAAGMLASESVVQSAARRLARAATPAGVSFRARERQRSFADMPAIQGEEVPTWYMPPPATPGRDLGLGKRVYTRPAPPKRYQYPWGGGLGMPRMDLSQLPRIPSPGNIMGGRREKVAESMRWLDRELAQMTDRFANNFARAVSGRRRDFGDLFRRAGQDLKEMLARAVYEATIGDTMRSVMGQFGKLMKRMFGGKTGGLLGGGELFGKQIMPTGGLNLSLPALALTAGMNVGGTAGKVLSGAALGFMVGGPIGALAGGLIGGLFHDPANDRGAKQSGRDLARHFLSGVEDQQRRAGAFTMAPAVARRDEGRLARLIGREIQAAQPNPINALRARASTRLTLGTRDLEETVHDLHFTPSVVV